jgi:uncharacterized protein YndB with AHSA1/START domain
MADRIAATIRIDAAPAAVWRALTQPELMVQWMGAPEMQLKVDTRWEVNTPVIITGFHHVHFENKGIVLHFEPEQKLAYSHWSSVSRLPDDPEHYSIIEFRLEPAGIQTLLSLTIEHFPTETIFKHLQFYWRTTMAMIKKFAEQQATPG